MTVTPAPSMRQHLGHIARNAWPVLISQWAGVAFGVLDTAMTGHASPADLAAMGLSVSIYITVFVGLMGVLHALIPILSQQYGARQYHELGRTWGQGVWLALILSAIGSTLLLFPNVWLGLSGDVAPDVRQSVAGYLQALALALPFALVFRTIYALGNAVSRPKIVMTINLTGIGFKALFNWLLIYGNLGLPALGAQGAGLSTALVYVLSLTAGMLVLKHDQFFRQFSLRLGRIRWKDQKELLRLGLPMGGSYLIEVSAFTFMALLVAREGTYVIGAQQIISNLAALCFMMPMAIGVATASLSARALGAQTPAIAIQIGKAGILLALSGAVITACILFLGRPWIVEAYTDEPHVAAVVLTLMPMLVLFHIVDAMQCINSYLLRAHKVAFVPMLLQGVALGLVGLLGGWYLGLGPGQGLFDGIRETLIPGSPQGAGTMWLMASVGLGLSATLLHSWYRRVSRLALIEDR